MAVRTATTKKRKSFNFSMLLRLSYKTPMPYRAQRKLGRRRGAKWHYAAPPDGQWARPEP